MYSVETSTVYEFATRMRARMIHRAQDKTGQWRPTAWAVMYNAIQAVREDAITGSPADIAAYEMLVGELYDFSLAINSADLAHVIRSELDKTLPKIVRAIRNVRVSGVWIENERREMYSADDDTTLTTALLNLRAYQLNTRAMGANMI